MNESKIRKSISFGFSLLLAMSSLGIQAEEKMRYIPTIIELDGSQTQEELEAEGVEVWHRRGDLLLALVPAERENVLQKSRGIKSFQHGRRAVPAMDIAKTQYGADRIHRGENLPSPYTGKGTVVGFCDIYFDPMHINFVDSEGNCRIKKLVHYRETQGERRIMSDRAAYSQWCTDDSTGFHATHVAGIIAGSYTDNGYSGMAPDAEIVATVSQLYDVGLLAGAEEIIEYAKERGKTPVINMSVGSYNGPHDGTSLFSRYLAMLGEEAIICMASGNEGIAGSSHRIYADDSARTWGVRVHSSDWAQFDVAGITDVWSSNDTPVEVQLVLFDEDMGQPVVEFPVQSGPQPFVWEVDETDEEFRKYYTGTVKMTGGIDKMNGRWYTQCEYDVHTEQPAAISGGNWARYNIALVFTAPAGVQADIHNDHSLSRFVRWGRYPGANSGLSVSDLSTGENIVCVGMYNNRHTEPTLAGEDRVFDFEAGTVNSASGWGHLVDGRVLPHTVAPGGGMLSSWSRYYLATYPEREGWASYKLEKDGEVYYWGNESGTSMATPYVAGAIATWLEADPTLDVSAVLDVISKTNHTDVADPENPRHGEGWFDPYEGLKLVLRNAGVTAGSAEGADMKVVYRDGNIEVLNPLQKPSTLRVYAASGELVLAKTVKDSVETIPADALSPGLYIIKAESARPLKIAIN